DGAAIIGSLAVDLLVLHSPVDDIVGIEHAAAIYAAAKHPKSFVSLDKADHLLTKRGDSHFAAGIISAWAARCLGEGGDITAAEDDVVEGGLIVQSSPDNPLAHDIRVGNHLMRADEPPSFPGGHDSGPAPYDFLKAGLGACTAITIRLVAERKKWPLTGCRIIVHHQIKEGDEGGDIFTRELVLEGALNEEQRQFLLGIANKCPVHKTLERGAHIETVLKV
ncbi:MAG: OsmC family protein, partial [Candidatus Puniceispirillales bacterium WSBS_2018_MAG_OTU23]